MLILLVRYEIVETNNIKEPMIVVDINETLINMDILFQMLV